MVISLWSIVYQWIGLGKIETGISMVSLPFKMRKIGGVHLIRHRSRSAERPGEHCATGGMSQCRKDDAAFIERAT